MITGPQQGSINAESKSLAHAKPSERDQATGEDHFAHAAGSTCKACGRTIEPGQNARRRGDAGWVHDVCPAVPADRAGADR